MNKLPPLTPFLVSTFFVLVNHRELQPFVKWEELLGVWTLALAITYAGFRLVCCFVKDIRKAGLLTVLLVLFFCFYGDFDHSLKRLVNGCGWPALAHAHFLAPVLLTLFGVAAAAVLRTRWPLLRLKAVLRVFLAGMILATVLLLHLFPTQFVSRRDRPREVDEHGPFTQINQRPDIYYIVLDCYTSTENLKKFWGYDNSSFTAFLESNGFFVVPDAQANYDMTPRCMASALNMAHLQRPAAGLSEWGRVNRMCEIIDLASAPQKLRENGYEIVNLSLFDVAGQPQFYNNAPIDYLSLLDLMRLKSLFGYAESWWKRQHMADLHLKIFQRLAEAAAVPHPARPRFIYAHILAPHYPYVFHAGGKRSGLVSNTGTPQEYLEQLKYVNHLTTNAIATIRARSKSPPIIVLQGDHGFRALPAPNQHESARKILNAYHLPGGSRDWVYGGITPVNTFRVIFNRYFGAHYPLVPDEFHHRNDTLPLSP